MKKLLTAIQAVILYILTVMRAVVMVRKGKGVVFHNIRFLNGDKITMSDLMVLAGANKTIIMNSDEGRVIFNHGNPDGTLVNCENPSFTVSSRYFSELVPNGEYWLIACYNGMRQDYRSDTHIFKRVCPSMFPIHAPIIGSDMYVCSSNEGICKSLGIPLPSEEDIRKALSRLPEKE